MKNVFIINAHEVYPSSQVKLNQSMFEKATANLRNKRYHVQLTTMRDDYKVDKKIGKHHWADALILQSTCNWMGVPWSFKKYMDEVYTAAGARSSEAQTESHGPRMILLGVLGEVLGQFLDRHITIQSGVKGQVHDTHAAAAYFPDDLVGADLVVHGTSSRGRYGNDARPVWFREIRDRSRIYPEAGRSPVGPY